MIKIRQTSDLLKLPTMSLQEAIDCCQLYNYFDAFEASSYYQSQKNVLLCDDDLHCDIDLILDYDDEQIQSIWGRSCGMIITGNCYIKDNMINESPDRGPFIYIKKGLYAKSVVLGGTDITICDRAFIDDILLAHGNDGSINISSQTIAKLIVSYDHDTNISTDSPYWNSHYDMRNFKLTKYLYDAGLLDKELAEDCDAEDWQFLSVKKTIAYIKNKQNILRDAEV